MSVKDLDLTLSQEAGEGVSFYASIHTALRKLDEEGHCEHPDGKRGVYRATAIGRKVYRHLLEVKDKRTKVHYTSC